LGGQVGQESHENTWPAWQDGSKRHEKYWPKDGQGRYEIMIWNVEKDLKIRFANEDDIDNITKVRIENNEYFTTAVDDVEKSKQYLKKVIDDPDDLLYIIENCDEFAGCFSVTKDSEGNKAEFGRCMLFERFKGKGIFNKAASFVLKRFKIIIWLQVFHWNTRAIDSYRRLGFVKHHMEDEMWIMNYMRIQS
jgi:ribosomal protein S18 acetylase RimI-like enzyme